MKFYFGDLVIVDDGCLGVVIRMWSDCTYDIFVRSYDSIGKYKDVAIQKYISKPNTRGDTECEYPLT